MKYVTPIVKKFKTSDQNKISLQDLLNEPLEHMMAVLRNVLSPIGCKQLKLECMCFS